MCCMHLYCGWKDVIWGYFGERTKLADGPPQLHMSVGLWYNCTDQAPWVGEWLAS